MIRLANLQIAFRLVPAFIAALSGLAGAIAPSSEGGKKITGNEAESIADRVLAQLRPTLLEILAE